MESFRRSLSFQRHRRSDSESRLISKDTPSLRESEEHERDSLGKRARSSFDTLVIPNRVRYPSDKTRTSDPTSIDLHIAASLLSRAQSEPTNFYASTSTLPKPDLSESYLASYNATAKRFGLSEMSSEHDQELVLHPTDNDGAMDTPTKAPSKKNIFQRLSRKHSIGAIPSRRTTSTHRTLSLNDICRLGGVSVFSVPPAFAASHMIIPTSLAATAGYLLQHGRNTPGIFRIPGQTTVVQAIYECFQARLKPEDAMSAVEATISSTDLPNHIQYNVHDIASTFKRILWDLPGGILGATSTFKALSEIEAPPATKLLSSDDSETLPRSKFIALAILSIQSQQRRALICAVFALLAYLKLDTKHSAQDPSGSCSNPGPESMSSHAFGVVFAPVLLGNLSDEIEFHDGRKNSEAGSNNNTPRRGLLSGKKVKKLKSADCGPEIAAGVSRANAAAAVIEMLVRNWEEVVIHIRALQGLPVSRSVSQSSCGLRPKHSGSLNSVVALHRPSVPSLRPGRLSSLTKSVSNPNFASFKRPAQLDSGESIYTDGQESSSVSRSASVSNNTSIRHDPRVTSWSRNFSYSSSALQNIDEGARWPSLHLPGDRAPVRSSGGSGESAPWWERSSSDDTGPIALGVPAPPPSPSRLSASPSYDKLAKTRTRQAGTSDVDRVAAVTDENAKLPAVQVKLVQAVQLEQSPRAVEVAKPRSRNSEGLPAPALSKVLSPRGSLDSVLSPVRKADKVSLARASHRSLQHDVRGASHEQPDLTIVRSSPMASRRQKPTPGSDTRHKSSPLHGASSRKEPKKTPLPITPVDAEHIRMKDTGDIPKSDPAIKSKRSQIGTSSPKRPRRPEPSEDSTFDDFEGSKPHARQSHHQQYDRHSTIFRPPQLLPMPAEPEVARRLNFRSSGDQMTSRSTSGDYSSSSDFNRRASAKANIGTLYAEIRRLKSELDARSEENSQLRQQLDAMRRFKDSGTLSEKLRETEREMRFWMHKAHWAENNLRAKHEAREKQSMMRKT